MKNVHPGGVMGVSVELEVRASLPNAKIRVGLISWPTAKITSAYRHSEAEVMRTTLV